MKTVDTSEKPDWQLVTILSFINHRYQDVREFIRRKTGDCSTVVSFARHPIPGVQRDTPRRREVLCHIFPHSLDCSFLRIAADVQNNRAYIRTPA